VSALQPFVFYLTVSTTKGQSEEPHERPALLRDVVADRPARHRRASLQRVEDRALQGQPRDGDLHLILTCTSGV
jgi:hypothetical protein